MALSKKEIQKNRELFLEKDGVQDSINSIVKKYGFSQDELLDSIQFETGGTFSTEIKSGTSNARGLIQFHPDEGKTYKTIQGKKYEMADIKSMTELQQLDLVDSYFEENYDAKKHSHPYLTIAAPALGNKSWGKGSSQVKKNPSWVGKDGTITSESILKGFHSANGSSPESNSELAQAQKLYHESRKYLTTRGSIDSKNQDRIRKELEDFSKDFKKEHLPNKGYTYGRKDITEEVEKSYVDGLNKIYESNLKSLKLNDTTPQGWADMRQLSHFIKRTATGEDWGIEIGESGFIDSDFEVMSEDARFNSISVRAVPKHVQEALDNNEVLSNLDIKSTVDNYKQKGANKGILGWDIKNIADAFAVQDPDYDFMNKVELSEKHTKALDTGKQAEEASVDSTEEEVISDEDSDLGLLTDTTDVEKAVYDADGNAYDPDAPNFSGKGLVSKDDYNSWVDYKKANPDGGLTFEEFQDYSKKTTEEEEVKVKDDESKTEGDKVDPNTDGDNTETKEGLGSKLLSGLKANAGTVVSGLVGAWSLSKAMEEVDAPKLDGLSAGFRANLHEAREMAKKGFTPSEQANFRAKVDKAYNTGIENVVRGSAGNRARFLAGTGILDANKNSALLDFAAKDSEIRRQNQGRYDALLNFSETFESQKDEKEKLMSYEDKLKTKSAAAGLASSALGQAIKGMNSSGEDEYYSMLIQQFKDGQKKTNSEYSGIPESTSAGIKPQYTESSTAPPVEATNVEIKDINTPNSFTTPETEEWAEGRDEYAR